MNFVDLLQHFVNLGQQFDDFTLCMPFKLNADDVHSLDGQKNIKSYIFFHCAV